MWLRQRISAIGIKIEKLDVLCLRDCAWPSRYWQLPRLKQESQLYHRGTARRAVSWLKSCQPLYICMLRNVAFEKACNLSLIHI